MYCGHCGAAVEEHDQFCRSCGARFVDPAPAAVPPVQGVDAAAPLLVPISTSPFGAAPEPPEPTQLVPVVAGPGARGSRPFLIGGAFALIVIAGIVAFFVLRGDDSSAQPAPTGPTSPIESTTSTTDPLPSVATTLPVTVAPTAPPIETTTPTTPPPTAAPDPAPSTAPTSGTVPTNTATIPGAPPTTAAPVATTAAPPAATRPRATVTPKPATTATPTPAPTPTPTPTSGAPTPVGQTPVSGSSTVSAIHASAARASGIDSCGQPTTYRPANVLDGQLNTAWMTVGDGAGQYLEFTIAPGAQVSQLGLVPGYAKQDPCSSSDRFHDMRRIVEVRWTFDGGNAISQSLDPDSPTMQTLDIPPMTAAVVRLTITATTDVGTAGFDYAPISEVTLA